MAQPRARDDKMSETVKAWRCIGCGRIEAPQDCIGVCEYRRVEFVEAAQHEATLAELAALQERTQALERLLGRLARTTPRDGAWERSYRGFQDEARRLLAEETGRTLPTV